MLLPAVGSKSNSGYLNLGVIQGGSQIASSTWCNCTAMRGAALLSVLSCNQAVQSLPRRRELGVMKANAEPLLISTYLQIASATFVPCSRHLARNCSASHQTRFRPAGLTVESGRCLSNCLFSPSSGG